MPVGIYVRTEKHKKNLSIAQKGRKHSEESKKRMSFAHKGKKLSEETKKKLSINHKGMKGKCHSEETKREMSIAHKGIKHKPMSQEGRKNISFARKGKIPWNKNKTPSKKTKKKLSIANKGKSGYWLNKKLSEEHKKEISKSKTGLFVGKKNPNWQGGTGKKPYPYEWTETLKESIRQRDNYKCQLCSMPEIECMIKLSIHHIDHDKENLGPKNLITLCNKCNIKVNYNREKWIKIFKEKICNKKVNKI